MLFAQARADKKVQLDNLTLVQHIRRARLRSSTYKFVVSARTEATTTLQPATIKDVGGSGLSMAPTTPNLPAATSAQCGSETDDPADRGPEATFTQQSGGRRFSRTSNHHHPRHHHPRSLMMRNLLVLRTTTPIPAPLELHTTQGSARLPGAA